jgi:hypothetical protein
MLVLLLHQSGAITTVLPAGGVYEEYQDFQKQYF